MALDSQITRKPRKNRAKNTHDFINSESIGGELWLNTNQIKLASIKTDRKTVDPLYIKELAASMFNSKQQQAAIVRENNNQYELIVGQCRLEAAKYNNEKLLCRIVSYADDEAIYAIIAENEKRRDNCDYDKAQFYIDCVRNGYYKNQSDLVKKNKLAKAYVSRLFKLKLIPVDVQEALPMTSFSSTKIEDIAKRISDSTDYVDAFIKHSDKIEKKTWTQFLSFIDNKVTPKEVKRLKSHIIRSGNIELGSIKHTDKGYSVSIKRKMCDHAYDVFEEGLETLLKKCSNLEHSES